MSFGMITGRNRVMNFQPMLLIEINPCSFSHLLVLKDFRNVSAKLPDLKSLAVSVPAGIVSWGMEALALFVLKKKR